MKGPMRREDTKKECGILKKESKEKKKKSECYYTCEEAKAACKTRKRKERQESISSVCQDRKVIRSNSEERPNSKRSIETDVNIRRVFSSEDFQTNKNQVNPVYDRNVTLLVVDECENEKRRSHERFSKPLTLKCKKLYSKKPKGRSLKKYKVEVVDKINNNDFTSTENELTEDIEKKMAAFLQVSTPIKNRSPSPPKCFDFTTLHQQVGTNEPLPSCSNRVIGEDVPSIDSAVNRLLSSPRNSIIATHCIYMDPDVSYNSIIRKTLNPIEERIQKLNKQINTCKKKLKKFESEFMSKHGFKPSQIDKLNDENAKTLYTELNKCKKEMKSLDSSPTFGKDDDRHSDLSFGKQYIGDTLFEIKMKLTAKRESSHRCNEIDSMTNEQLMDEKVAVQKALLHLENLHGRPQNKEERDMVRPLYERYRTLKRMVSKITVGANPINDLETIHEDETMNFIAESVKSNEDASPTEKASTISTITDSEEADTSTNENLSSMSSNELQEQLKIFIEEKKVLKRSIKEYENDLQQKTGKMLQKDDRLPINHLYQSYKQTKAKLRLLDALISKK